MRFLQVSVEVMTRDAATADMIKQHDPMLRNDLLMLLGSQTYETISTREGKEKLRDEALAGRARRSSRAKAASAEERRAAVLHQLRDAVSPHERNCPVTCPATTY